MKNHAKNEGKQGKTKAKKKKAPGMGFEPI